MQWIPESLATDITRCWQETFELYYGELQEKLKAYLAKATENKKGCLEFCSSSAPAEVQWWRVNSLCIN